MKASQSNSAPLGFFALWLNKPSEYRADAAERDKTVADIQVAFAVTVENGTEIYSAFEARWSTERQYFAFWETPSFEVLEAAMNHLEQAGDFKFAKSEHIIGTKLKGALSQDVSPTVLHQRDWFACFFIWTWRDTYYDLNANAKKDVEAQLNELFVSVQAEGAKPFGYYDSRFSSRWDRFIFCLFPAEDVLDEVLTRADEKGLFKYIKPRTVLGKLNTRYRFAKEYMDD